MKRIIILCDGTWNFPDETKEGVLVPTNVVKLAQAMLQASDGVPQLVFCDAGIGSSGSMIHHVYDGATRTGISANILRAYQFLIEQFEIGDGLFLFGFSRGAFTVRRLAGLIRNVVILRG